MNRVGFGEGACEKTRRYMDAYISNELLVETNHDVIRHLDSCPACSAELETRSRVRSRLKSAVQAQAVPPELTALVRERIRTHQGRGWFPAGWKLYAMAATAVVVICAAVWVTPSRTPLPELTDRPAQANYIQKIAATVASVFKPGLADHIHCAVFRKYPQNPPTVQQMEQDLGEQYKSLLQLVTPAIPEGYRIVMAHRCSYAGRHYVHVTMRKGSDLISLVITQKNVGETMSTLSPAMNASGVPLYEASTERYKVAGFESDHYLGFIVSDLKAKANLQIAATLAPVVRQLMS